MPHDRWGEPISVQPRTYSLASLMAVITLVAFALGWLSLLRTHPGAAAWLIVGVAVLLGVIVGHRQPGGRGTKLAAGIGFTVGAVFVGGYIFGWALMLVHGPWAAVDPIRSGAFDASRPPGWSEVDTFFTCFLALLGFPAVAVIAWILTAAWTRLAESRSFAMSIIVGGYETRRPR
jgi:hypothetical protein